MNNLKFEDLPRVTEQLLESLTRIEDELKVIKKNLQPKLVDEFLTRKEASGLLKISLVCLHDWCNKGILKAYKMGNRTYFSRKEIIEQLFNSNY